MKQGWRKTEVLLYFTFMLLNMCWTLPYFMMILNLFFFFFSVRYTQPILVWISQWMKTMTSIKLYFLKYQSLVHYMIIIWVIVELVILITCGAVIVRSTAKYYYQYYTLCLLSEGSSFNNSKIKGTHRSLLSYY